MKVCLTFLFTLLITNIKCDKYKYIASIGENGNYNFVIDKDGDGFNENADESEHFAIYDNGDAKDLLDKFTNPTAVEGKSIVEATNSEVTLIRFDPNKAANAVVANANGAWRLVGEDFHLILDKDVVTTLEIVYPNETKVDLSDPAAFAHENIFEGVTTNYITVVGNKVVITVEGGTKVEESAGGGGRRIKRIV